MPMSLVLWILILGFFVVFLLRHIGCGWWSLFGILSGSFLAIGLIAAASKIREFFNNRKIKKRLECDEKILLKK